VRSKFNSWKRGQKKPSWNADKAQQFKQDKVRGGLWGLAGQREDDDAGDEKQIMVLCFARQGARESSRTREVIASCRWGGQGWKQIYENLRWSLEGRFRTSFSAARRAKYPHRQLGQRLLGLPLFQGLVGKTPVKNGMHVGRLS